MVGAKSAALFASRMSSERSAGQLRPRNGAGERSRTVVSALARPHSAVEPHPRGVPSRIDFPSLASQMPQVTMFAIANCNLTDNLTLRTRPL